MKTLIFLKRVFLITLVSISFISCNNNTVYKETKEFKTNSWNRIKEGKDVTFEKINIPSVEDTYDIYVSFRHTPYINIDEISFVLRVISPSGIKKETVHTIKLKDREGKDFVGEQLGDIIDVKEVVKQYTYFPEKGEYKFVISNFCSKFEVTGIMDVGLQIKKSDLDYDVDAKK